MMEESLSQLRKSLKNKIEQVNGHIHWKTNAVSNLMRDSGIINPCPARELHAFCHSIVIGIVGWVNGLAYLHTPPLYFMG